MVSNWTARTAPQYKVTVCGINLYCMDREKDRRYGKCIFLAVAIESSRLPVIREAFSQSEHHKQYHVWEAWFSLRMPHLCSDISVLLKKKKHINFTSRHCYANNSFTLQAFNIIQPQPEEVQYVHVSPYYCSFVALKKKKKKKKHVKLSLPKLTQRKGMERAGGKWRCMDRIRRN